MAVDNKSKKKDIKYKIVKYLYNNELTTVPESWLGKTKVTENNEEREVDTSAWPKGESDYNIANLVSNKSKKKPNWPMLPVEILGTATTLMEAKAKEKIASSDESCTDLDAVYDRQRQQSEKDNLKGVQNKRSRKRKHNEDYKYNLSDEGSSSSESNSEVDDRHGNDDLVDESVEPPEKDVFPSISPDGETKDRDSETVRIAAIAKIIEQNSGPSDENDETNNEEKSEFELEDRNKENHEKNDEIDLWHIVKFLKSTKFTVIPSIWLTEDQQHARWPPSCNNKDVIIDYIIPQKEPADDWRTRSIKEHAGTAETYAAGLETVRTIEGSNSIDETKMSDKSNGSIEEKSSSSRKSLSELTDSDLNVMSERDLIAFTLTGFREMMNNQNKIMHEIKMQKLTEGTASTSGYKLNNLREDFRATTIAMFKENEKKLKEEAFRTAVESFLADQGGPTGHKFCTRMLECCLADNVASKFVFVGNSKTKGAFSQTEIWNVIRGVAVERFKNHPEQKYSFANADETCSTWLRQAPFRLVKRKRKTTSRKMTLEDLKDEEDHEDEN